jgi:exopolysaccharide production protein ExoY
MYFQHLEIDMIALGSAAISGRAATEMLLPAVKSPRLLYFRAKRLFDIAFTLAAAPFVLTIVGILALLIMLDGGQPFYSQSRVGKHGMIFRLWKLRSMVPDAEQALETLLASSPEARAEWDRDQKLKRDPRITPVGRFIRKYSLDELPQFINVLMGHMSLVGPRPMFPEQLSHYAGNDYFGLRPGLTGLWQISMRSNSSFGERAVLDTRYAGIMSLSTDIQIIALTSLAVYRGTGV